MFVTSVIMTLQVGEHEVFANKCHILSFLPALGV